MPRINEYSQAVLDLLALAKKDCGGSLPAALTLLSAYDSFAFQLPLASLRVLDGSYQTAALKIITISASGINPQELITNGHEKFEELAKIWQHQNKNEVSQ